MTLEQKLGSFSKLALMATLLYSLACAPVKYINMKVVDPANPDSVVSSKVINLRTYKETLQDRDFRQKGYRFIYSTP